MPAWYNRAAIFNKIDYLAMERILRKKGVRKRKGVRANVVIRYDRRELEAPGSRLKDAEAPCFSPFQRA